VSVNLYENIKDELLRTKAAIWYDNVCKHKQLATNMHTLGQTVFRNALF